MTVSMKYARLERERRFLLSGPPTATSEDRVLDVEDRYLDGTRLRLRVVRERGATVRKLGHKVRVDPGTPSTVACTSVYLDAGEHAVLARLPGATLTKRRTVRDWNGLTLAVDVFTGELDGLVLAEVDLGESGEVPAGATLPSPLEVTEDERFTGGALARTGRAQLRVLLGDRAPSSGPA